MNRFVEERYIERIDRLALGLIPLDAVRRCRIAHPIQVHVESGAPKSDAVVRHNSCLHALTYTPKLASSVVIRFVDRAERFVPRRLKIPLPELDPDDTGSYAGRVRSPWLFPGAAYDTSERATGLRGRVRRANGKEARWARVEVLVQDSSVVVGRGHADHHGEFLVIVDSGARPAAGLFEPLTLDVHVYGAPPKAPSDPGLPARDPFWDLPEEQVPDPGEDDLVSPGEELPDGYTLTANRVVTFTLGHLVSEKEPFVLS